MKKAIFTALFAVALTACGASSHILVGKERPPIDPDQVKLYLQPPAAFEQVAILEATSAGPGAFTNQQKTDKVLKRLKQEAADVGANGILLQAMDREVAGSVGNSFGTATAWGSGNSAYAYGSGFGMSSTIMQKVGKAIAIYVTDDSMPPPPSPSLPMTPPPPPARPTPVAPAQSQPYELDPAKRCDACQRLTR
jgi:hypothetical protein